MMKKGEYYIGDLCYVMSDSEWNEVCNLTIHDSKNVNGEFEFSDGRKFAIYGTAFGDGVYISNIDTEHCVDSGTIGCILKSDIEVKKYEIEDLGAFVTFENDFETGYIDNSIIMFGHVKIETNWDESDESDEYYDDEEWNG